MQTLTVGQTVTINDVLLGMSREAVGKVGKVANIGLVMCSVRTNDGEEVTVFQSHVKPLEGVTVE